MPEEGRPGRKRKRGFLARYRRGGLCGLKAKPLFCRRRSLRPRTGTANGEQQHLPQRMSDPPRLAKIGSRNNAARDWRHAVSRRQALPWRAPINHGTQENHALCQSLSAVNPNTMPCLDMRAPMHPRLSASSTFTMPSSSTTSMPATNYLCRREIQEKFNTSFEFVLYKCFSFGDGLTPLVAQGGHFPEPD